MDLINKAAVKLNIKPKSYSKKSRFEFGRTLGAGAYGEVKIATIIETGQQVAIK
jgi:serine/threonine protein kinase